MEKENQKPFAIISFLSGKGGSGKTTAALGIAKIFADVGFKILLVDFDLATSGASYFFSPRLSDPTRQGLAEFLKGYHQNMTSDSTIPFEEQLKSLILPISQNFDFIPSRSQLGQPFVTSPEIHQKEFLVTTVLEPLIKGIGQDYDYILIDNQAGYSNLSAAGASVATKAIVVAESDRISSDAVDNLIALIGSDMPRFRRYLINKVEIREPGDYRSKVEAFRAMNRLPPLPFDFSVRNAFGEREIPVELEKPTPFLIALFTTVKEILPEKKEHLEKYETEKVTTLFDRYQTELDALLEERNQIQEQMIAFETLEKKRESDNKILMYRLMAIGATVLTVLASSWVLFPKVLKFLNENEGIVPALAATMVASIVAFYFSYRSRQLSKTAQLEEKHTKEQLALQRKLSDIEAEVNRYRNLIVTRSRDLLVDFDPLSGMAKND